MRKTAGGGSRAAPRGELRPAREPAQSLHGVGTGKASRYEDAGNGGVIAGRETEKPVSNNESFIDEVTEEVRRDRLFALMRKYGWIAILAIVLLVGGAAWNEWRKAQARAAAEALGDSILAALETADPAARAKALAAIDATGDTRAVVALLAAEAQAGAGEREAAGAALQAIADDAQISPLYRDMARLRIVMLAGAQMSEEERRGVLEALVRPGSPFRLLGEEQLAALDIEAGRRAEAIERLRAIYNDSEAGPEMRQRVGQLIIALGGTPENT